MNAPNSKTPQNRLRFERELRGWSQEDLAEKVGTTQKIVSRWERGESTPLPYYRQKLCKFFGKNAAELGLIDQEETYQIPDLPTEERANEGPDTSQIAPPLQHIDTHQDEDQPLQLFIPNYTPHIVTIHIHQQAPISTSALSDEHAIIDSRMTTTLEHRHPGEIEEIVNRREFGQRAWRIGSAAFFAYHGELLERFLRALKKPSTVDGTMLIYLERHTENYWYDRHTVALASHHLIEYVLEHFLKVTSLLEEPLLPTVRTRLCSIAGGIALLVGELLFDMRCYAQARKYYTVAVEAAQEADNQALQAVSWGRMSFTWTYEGNPQAALVCVQTARHVGGQSINATTRAWLAAVEAEIQANLHERNSTLKALDEAENVEQRDRPQDCYWIHFDPSLSAGYRGVSLLRLYRPEDPQTTSFLTDAQRTLTKALDFLDPTLTRRKPNILADLAGTYIQQKEVEAACEHAIEAVILVSHIQSKVVLQRLLSRQHELDPWKYTESVQRLDAKIRPLLKTDWYQGNV
jgi:transcriptional regulator with XRE-family HTH domain/tetratricopeptide (TPR) repeat protein